MQEGTLDMLIFGCRFAPRCQLGVPWHHHEAASACTEWAVRGCRAPPECAIQSRIVPCASGAVALSVEGRGVGRERSAIQRSASRSAPKLMQKALSSWRPRPIPLIASVERGGTSRGRGKRVVRRTARAAGRAETFHSPSSPERRCVPAVVPSRSASSPSPVGMSTTLDRSP